MLKILLPSKKCYELILFCCIKFSVLLLLLILLLLLVMRAIINTVPRYMSIIQANDIANYNNSRMSMTIDLVYTLPYWCIIQSMDNTGIASKLDVLVIAGADMQMSSSVPNEEQRLSIPPTSYFDF
ncbi:hypothetical protein QTP88_024198 [Uroleucon formosanum]